MDGLQSTATATHWTDRLRAAILTGHAPGIDVEPDEAAGITRYTVRPTPDDPGPMASTDALFALVGHVNDGPFCGAESETLLLSEIGLDGGGPYATFSHRPRSWNGVKGRWKGRFGYWWDREGNPPYQPDDFDRLS